jgi:uncharacterized membrane protein YphA (DoxX/SURF4 family)
VGVGSEVFLYAVSIRPDWIELLAVGNRGLIRRDLMEALLSVESPFIPRIGWIVEAGGWLHLNENTVLWFLWGALIVASLLLVLGLFCRTSSIIAWILFLFTAKSAEPFGYGVDNFTIIGLFYLVIAPVPDAWSIDARWRGISLKGASLQGLHRRVLQLHLCIIYFFSGLAKCAGRGWWNGTSLWRALIRPPFDIVSPDILIRFVFLLPLAGILVCVMEATYPVFIWPRKTRLIWFVGVLTLHAGIGVMMGLYLFAWVMIVLNLAAFGPEFAFKLPKFSFVRPRVQSQAEPSST